MSDDILRADQSNADRMAKASATFANALNSGFGPERFMWAEHTGGQFWTPSEDPRDYRSLGLRRALASQAEKSEAEMRRVSRDPCPVCATRTDIGCKHRRVA